MGKKSKNSSGRVHFPEYLEDRHWQYIDRVKEDVERVKVLSPYSEYEDIDIDVAFFGAGYVLGSFPSLYDMYGKFMAGLDVEYLFDQAFKNTTDGPVIHNLVSEQASILSDDLANDIIPRYEVGMRDINAVESGTFVIGKAAVLDIDGYNYEMHAKDLLWPFTVYDFERLALSAVGGGGGGTSVGTAGASRTAKVLGGALSGAASGAMVTPGAPWLGGAIGGVLGLASGFF